ncbi:MAG: carboxypeptidase-like regulatory domain-containing protein, partial [Bryobacteraceae bacterium]
MTAIFLSLLLAGTPALWAQTYAGSLTGVVSDPSGAVIPGARATLTDEQRGLKYPAATDSSGRYLIRNLPPGNYELSVSAPGMQLYNRPGITLTVGQNAQANVKLQVGGTTQTVTVDTTAPLLETQDASTGQLVNHKFVNDLPLTSRSVYNLAQLAPGVTQAPGSAYGLNESAVNFVSNGGRNSTSGILIDGVSQTNNEQTGGVSTALYTPEVD